MSKMKTKSKSKMNKNKVKVNKRKVNPKPKKSKEAEEWMSGSDGEESDELNAKQIGDESDDDLTSIVDHKKSLQSLKETDKEFYEFLQQNDKQLLDFDINDEDVDEDSEEDNELDTEGDQSEGISKLSVKQVNDWSHRLEDKADIETIKSVVKWFRRAVNQTSGESDGQIMNAEVFNAITNVCLIDLLPAVHKILKLPQIGSNEWSSDVKVMDPTKSRNWKKVMAVMKCYLTDVIKMVGSVSEQSLKTTLLRHILHLIPFLITFPHLIKRVLKQTLESYKTVYNWQFLNSILLWTQLLCSHNTVDELKPLISPLVNVIIGTIRLIPSAKYFPMRFHLIKALIKLSDETNAFIPILPFVTQVFDNFDKQLKKNKSNDEKELNFDLLIKVSNISANDFQFRDSTINKIRKFIKRSHVVQHNQLLKQLLDKIEDNSKLICEKRKNVEFSISDSLSINSWESQMKCDGTPLNHFYNQRKKIKSNKDISDINVNVEPKVGTSSGTTEAAKPTSAHKLHNQSNSKKRKLNESQSKGTENKSKKVKKSRNRKKSVHNNNRKTNVSFDLNQTLDISSDECD
ncbi:unnamed protein product [Oppiella nova]|uniref:Nucleolar complex protein 2 homolog n=1 Tax=Oppiella nova TaxID=334625 RepID=A0A7R9LWU2_9ACAR|nr:unnamed protein product [Oppiella nova]CAG2167082.1 unnamed protein product [Oppiella nova]